MKDFKKYFKVYAEPEDIYAALTNPFTIELWSGYPATMSEEEGSEFSLWEGDISGRNLKFEKNKLIEQEWFFGEESPTPSIVTIKIHPDKKYTSVEVRHTNIPDEAYDNIVEGWTDFYMDAIQSFFEAE